MPELTPSEAILRDPLSDVTRKERRFLLGSSVLGVAIVKTGLVPSKISTFGIEFAQTNKQALLGVYSLIVAYFLIAFIIYASSDFLAWRLSIIKAFRIAFSESQRRRKMTSEHVYRGPSIFYISRGPVSIIRAIFEFLLPIVFGVYAFISLWTAHIPSASS